MINMISADIKEGRRFGRLNRFLIKQLFGLSFIGFFAVGFMLSGLNIINVDEEQYQQSITEKTSRLEPLKTFEDQAKKLNASVSVLQKLFEREVKFSRLIVDIASSIPNGARLTSLTLTGDRTEPLQISAEMTNQSLAAVMKKSLVDSGIFVSADIINITPEATDEIGTFTPATASFSVLLAPEASTFVPPSQETGSTANPETPTSTQTPATTPTQSDEPAGNQPAAGGSL